MLNISNKTSFAIFPEITSSFINLTNLPKFSGLIGESLISKSFSLRRENNSEVIQFTTIFDDCFKLSSTLITLSKKSDTDLSDVNTEAS